ncbi:EamA family transporter RarD [Chitinibacter bivalviorum]|uniref:EamA family transporter RarD n=1 Tax=Chitinibacter bivalviorum TaxID=2739434 RepID=A0A7H9BJI9_9NEIS|nr:EamA family transporter RarD [Chitinibacter bivalviorum]QLG88733.1 EamA family transporter RarD [Chitinibacter bivalviorum]
MNSGLLSAALAYLIWGLFPLYFKVLQFLPAGEIVLHRIVWALLFLLGILTWRGQWQWLAQLKNRRLVAGFALSAVLLSINWFVYIWAANSGRVVDASLGYFINPLINVLLGVLVLHERLRTMQWVCIAIAGAGVAWLTVSSGQLPWVALTVATTFGIYGLLRKTAHLGALEGLTLETALLFPLAVAGLVYLSLNGENGFSHTSTGMQITIMLSGPITAIPLLLFAAAARKITMVQLGLMQYLGPSVQLILAIWLWHEPFGIDRRIGFGLIWLALILFSAEGYLKHRATYKLAK